MKRHFFTLNSESEAHFFLEGENYFNFYIDLIQSAKKIIHLQIYIFEMDSFGQRVFEALISAAQRGVKVYLAIDGVGSRLFTNDDEELLILNGITVCRFNEINLRWFYQWGRRLHHKILLVDDEQAIVGGINVTTSGYGHKHNSQQLDFAVSLTGTVVTEIAEYCQFVFSKACQKSIAFDAVVETAPAKSAEGDMNLKISINDWVYRRRQITNSYSTVTEKAKREITIINSYFFPRKKFMKQLVDAVGRGVRVRLVLPAISDWPSSILASQYLYDYFLKNGVEIYQWKNSVLHGKLATVDGYYSTIGSFNLNYTSYNQNLEMNVDIFSKKFTTQVDSIINEIILVGCEKIEKEAFVKKTTLRLRFLRFAFYAILSIVSSFSVTLTYQEEAHPENRYLSMLRIFGALIFFFLGVIGAILPVIPGIPFFVISFFLVYRQILFNRKIEM